MTDVLVLSFFCFVVLRELSFRFWLVGWYGYVLLHLISSLGDTVFTIRFFSDVTELAREKKNEEFFQFCFTLGTGSQNV